MYRGTKAALEADERELLEGQIAIEYEGETAKIKVGKLGGGTYAEGIYIGGAAAGGGNDPRISDTQISNWDTAYGWGNHASAGYASAAAVSSALDNYAPLAGANFTGSVSVLGTNNSVALSVRPNAAISSAYNTFEVLSTAGAVLFSINRNGPVTINSTLSVTTINATLNLTGLGSVMQVTNFNGSSTIGVTSLASLGRKLMLGKTETGTIAGIDVSGTLELRTLSPSTTGLIIQGFTDQTANLTEWRNNSGSIIASVNSIGDGQFRSLTIATTFRVSNLFAVSGQNLLFAPGGSSSSVNIESYSSAPHALRIYAGFGQYNNTVNTYKVLLLNSPFSPTSGSGNINYIEISSEINQTGGANGIARGIFINPTLTSATDYRAIHTTNGKIIFENLPTSSFGLPSGTIYNDGGTLKIV
jgi:hypothetical protein